MIFCNSRPNKTNQRGFKCRYGLYKMVKHKSRPDFTNILKQAFELVMPESTHILLYACKIILQQMSHTLFIIFTTLKLNVRSLVTIQHIHSCHTELKFFLKIEKILLDLKIHQQIRPLLIPTFIFKRKWIIEHLFCLLSPM